MTRMSVSIAQGNNPLWGNKKVKGPARTNPFGRKGIPEPDAPHYGDRLSPADAEVIASAVIARKPDQCQWPIGEGKDFHFCSNTRASSKPPYCTHHVEEAKGSR